MSNRPQFEKRIPLINVDAAQAREGSPFTHIEVSFFYSEGGTSWVSGERQPKGYALSFRGIEVKDDNSFSFMMFTGWQLAFVVKPAARFSRSTLAKLWASLDVVALAAKFEADDVDGIRAALAPYRQEAAA